MTITITPEDISLAQATENSCGLSNYRCTTCPIARAAKRAFQRPVYVSESNLVVYFVSPFTQRLFPIKTYSLPRIASKFALDFDMGRDVQPFSFTIQ